jgi:cell division protein FtsB
MSFLKNLFLVFLIIFLSSSLIRNIFDYQKKMEFYKKYQEELRQEKKKKLTLQTEILKKTDPFELEKTIRDKLNLSQPGELSVILPEKTPTPTQITPTPLPNWQQWLNLFH